MITLIITLASVVFYALFGWLAAIRNLPRAWREAREFWHDSSMARGSVKARTVFMFLFWPFYLPGRAVGDWFGHVVDVADPEVAEAKMREQARRIRQLEKDLGLR